MGAPLPKQFMLLKGRPVLMHTLEAFHTCDPEIQLYLVLPPKEKSRWHSLCKDHHFEIPHQSVDGGDERTASVQNGLQAIPEVSGLVAIHDGVRPLVEKQVILDSFEAAAAYGNGVASVRLKDSIRKYEEGESEALDRERFRLIQTPQTFRLELIRQAYQHLGKAIRTDDASVLEEYGEKIRLIEGSYANLKITTAEDLKIAEALL